jgi:hypothetical protein
LISALIEAPCDRVQQPEEYQDEGDDGILFLEADTASGYPAPVAELAGEEHVGSCPEGIESPFVCGSDKSASEPRTDPDP